MVHDKTSNQEGDSDSQTSEDSIDAILPRQEIKASSNM